MKSLEAGKIIRRSWKMLLFIGIFLIFWHIRFPLDISQPPDAAPRATSVSADKCHEARTDMSELHNILGPKLVDGEIVESAVVRMQLVGMQSAANGPDPTGLISEYVATAAASLALARVSAQSGDVDGFSKNITDASYWWNLASIECGKIGH
jgi:hypothetical protein